MSTSYEELLRRFTDPPAFRHAAGPAGADWEPGFTPAPGLTPEQAARAPGLHGLVVARGGRIVREHYGVGPDFSWGRAHGEVAFGPGTLHDLRSVTKSVVALLYGIALDAGRVPDPATSLVDAFPEYPAPAGVTVEHALTMTLGLEWKEQVPYDSPANGEIAMMLAPDRWRYVLERPVVEPPGTRWNYCGGASELIGRLVAKGTGVPLPEYARDVLFGPLGIGSFEWMAGHDGVVSSASGLRLTPRDLARIGQAVLAGGQWQGRQVVPAGWLEPALRPRVETAWGDGYGYQWYSGGAGRHRWVGANGNGDQRLFVYPELDLVVAMTAGNYDGDGAMPPAFVHDVILAGL